MDLSSDTAAGGGGLGSTDTWGGVGSSSSNDNSSNSSSSSSSRPLTAAGLAYSSGAAGGNPLSPAAGVSAFSSPLPYSPLQQQGQQQQQLQQQQQQLQQQLQQLQQQQQLLQQQQQQQQPYSAWMGGGGPPGAVGAPPGSPMGAPWGGPLGGPQGPPCPKTLWLEVQQQLSAEDKKTLQQIGTRARAAAAATTLGLGILAMNIFKKKNWRYPILGASIVGLTVGPPLGFAGYMMMNYSKVQRMEEKFREAQTAIEARRRGFYPNMPYSYMGAPPVFRPEDAAAAAANPGVQTPQGVPPAALSPNELLKE
ncbi:hypothetical protein, conserved [Eimeria maxima]|uniref:Transmembrane protein n=1 Tax=Eimeria maxima TaxID=5804 RepID=U6LW85_EIMMA|nr:hypothetical protein, conserved [Eimeria maxima]CDJ56011.1 hypothetical protein, conserved [Eimeria maxima]